MQSGKILSQLEGHTTQLPGLIAESAGEPGALPSPDFASVAHTLSDALIVADADNVIVYANQALFSLLGWKPEEVVGKLVVDTVVPERHRSRHLQGFRRYVESSTPTIMGQPIQLAARAADGGEVDIELVLSPAKAADGSPVVVGLLRDARQHVVLERHSALIAELLDVLAHPDSIEETTTRIIRGICLSLDWDAGAIWMIDRPTNLLHCLEFWSAPSVELPEFKAFSRGTAFIKGVGLPGRVWETEEPAWFEDLSAEVSFPRRDLALREGLRCGFGVPISKDGQIVGVAEFFSRQVLPRQQELMDIMTSIGDQLGDFLFERAARQQLAFQNALLESQSEASIDGILVVSPRGEMIYFNRRFVELWGIPDEVVESRSDRLALQAVLDKLADPEAFLERVAYLYQHADETSRDELNLKDGRTFERHSAPVRADDGTYYGRVWFFRDITGQKQAAEELASAYRAEAAARADAERARSELAFLLEASSALSASLDFVQGLGGLANVAVPKLADICLVHLVDQRGTARRVAVVHRDPANQQTAEMLLASSTARDDNAIGRVIATAQPELSSRADRFAGKAADEASQRAAARLGIGSYLCVPIIGRGRVLGTLTLASAESGRRYGSEQMIVSRELSSRAAIAIDNARLFQETRNIAHTLQQSLLPPQLPHIPGIELAALYRPGKEGSEVGGDFYDAFELKGDEWALVIGDVCGKGAAAATLTALARHTLQAAAAVDGDPKQVLALVNAAFLREGSGRFCTLVYAGLRREGRRVVATVSAAGHPPALVLHPDGQIEAVLSNGSLLGVLAEPDLTPASVTLNQGDSLIFYTDGLADLVDRRLPPGASLTAILSELAGRTPSEIVAALEDVAERASHSGYPDDIAVLVCRIPFDDKAAPAISCRSTLQGRP